MQPLIPYFEPIRIPLFGDFAVHGFGILVALGLFFGARLAQWKTVRDGQDPDFINRLLGWVVVGVFVGGHFGHALFYQPEYYLENPIELLKFWDGLSSYGGFIASYLFGYALFKREDGKIRDANKLAIKEGRPRARRLHIWGYADSVLVGLSLGWGLGRTGCFSAHDHPGTATDFYLGVYGICPDQPITVACHDMGLYEAIMAFAMCGLFLLLERKPRFPGFFAGLGLALYGPTRFFMDFFRTSDVDVRYIGLTPAQYGSLAVCAIGLWILWSRKDGEPLRLSASAEAAAAAGEASEEAGEASEEAVESASS